jgi:hypothetical protein
MPHASHALVQQAMAATRKHLGVLLQQSQSDTQCSLGMQPAMHGFVVSVCGKVCRMHVVLLVGMICQCKLAVAAPAAAVLLQQLGM